jgi:pyocin large subunit-like protein
MGSEDFLGFRIVNDNARIVNDNCSSVQDVLRQSMKINILVLGEKLILMT